MKLRAFLLSLLLLASTSAQAAAFLNWTEDFESYTSGQDLPDTNGWDNGESGAHPKATVQTTGADSGGPQAGSKMLQMNRTGGSAAFEVANLVFSNAGISVGSEIFVRFWYRLDADHFGTCSPPVGAKHWRIRASTLQEFDQYIASHGLATDCITFEGQVNQETAQTYFGGQGGSGTAEWVKWEFYANMPSGSNWTTKAWLNDILVYNKTWGEGQKPVRFLTNSNAGGPGDTNNHTYIDSMEVYTDVDSGLGGSTTGSMANGDIQPSGGDTTPPVLSNPTDGTPTSDGAQNATVSTDEASGTLYWVVVSDGGAATDAQIKAGSGGNIVVAGNQSVTATGTQTVSSITGLSASTDYEIIYLHSDGAGNDSNQSEVPLTTTAAGVQKNRLPFTVSFVATGGVSCPVFVDGVEVTDSPTPSQIHTGLQLGANKALADLNAEVEVRCTNVYRVKVIPEPTSPTSYLERHDYAHRGKLAANDELWRAAA